MNFFKNIINQNNFFGIIVISIFSLAVNQYYANQGVFPHDSFSHFETGSMILKGYHPFKDYWVVSGPFIDYSQAFLFLLFGVNWKTYVFHASLINIVISIFTFLTFRNLGLNFKKSLFFSLCFSILAYPSSGTPFVDHHSSFFSLLAIYMILMCINTESKYLTFFTPIFFILAFFSKQVPAIYLMASTIPIFVFYIFFNKKTYLLPPLFYGSISFILMSFLFGLSVGINYSDFIEQYFVYPQSIASSRFENLNVSIIGVMGNFKFILLGLLILIIVSAKKINKNRFLISKDTYISAIIISCALILIFHQILTRNQIFIFFLIPLILGVINILVNQKFLSYFTIILCLLLTIKYHERFNEGRKFHEMQDVNLSKAVDAKLIDNKLDGLKWISPQFKEDPMNEIKIINEIKTYLKKDKRKKMVLGNYPFLSAIIGENLYSTTRWHVLDGTDYPLPQSSYFESYRNLTEKVIANNNIKVIYSIFPVTPENIYSLINKTCLKEKKINEFFVKFEFKKCE